MKFKIIDSALKSVGCFPIIEHDEHGNIKRKFSGKGTTACYLYRAEDQYVRFTISVQATPKKELITSFLEGGDKN